MSSVASSRTTSRMSSTATMPTMRSSASTTGIATRSCRASSRATSSWSVCSETRTTSVFMTVGHRLVRRSREQLAHGDHADQAVLGVQHVGVVQRADALEGLPAQVRDGFVDRISGRMRAYPRVHQSARLVLRVCEECDDLAARGLVQVPQQLFAHRARRRLDAVGGVVRRQSPRPAATLLLRQLSQQAGLSPPRRARGRTSRPSSRDSSRNRAARSTAERPGQSSLSPDAPSRTEFSMAASSRSLDCAIGAGHL